MRSEGRPFRSGCAGRESESSDLDEGPGRTGRGREGGWNVQMDEWHGDLDDAKKLVHPVVAEHLLVCEAERGALASTLSLRRRRRVQILTT